MRRRDCIFPLISFVGPFPLVRLERRTCLFSPTIVSDLRSSSIVTRPKIKPRINRGWIFGSGEGIRTPDQRIMIPLLYHWATPPWKRTDYNRHFSKCKNLCYRRKLYDFIPSVPRQRQYDLNNHQKRCIIYNQWSVLFLFYPQFF